MSVEKVSACVNENGAADVIVRKGSGAECRYIQLPRVSLEERRRWARKSAEVGERNGAKERKIRARASQPGLFDAGIAGDAEQHSGIINR